MVEYIDYDVEDLFVMCNVILFLFLRFFLLILFFFQAEDGIRDLVRSRGLGDVYKRQLLLSLLRYLLGKYSDEKFSRKQTS